MTQDRATRVVIVGGGPAGMLLSHMLELDGIDSVVLERASKAHVLSRVRAGVLEYGTVQLLRDVGLGERMDREGLLHDGTYIAWQGHERFLIDTVKHTGKPMMAYGQTAITETLYAAREKAGAEIVDEATDVVLHDVDGSQPSATYRKAGREYRLRCDFIAGCDGFHGVSRTAVPRTVLKTFERTYPFGWLGVMSETRPLDDIVYVQHERGFALCSQRSPQLSRYYIQCDRDVKLDDWPDERFWQELMARCPPEMARQIGTGPSIEKSVAPLRSFVAEPMRHGRLFLAGDAAHIVPPTGAKGLNLAVSDVFYLHRALVERFKSANDTYIDSYSQTALRRVWSAERLSWWLTHLLHAYPARSAFETRIVHNEFDHLCTSERAQAALAEQYVGLPFD